MFSSRLPAELAPNALSRAVERARRSGQPDPRSDRDQPDDRRPAVPGGSARQPGRPPLGDLPARPARDASTRAERSPRTTPRAASPSTRPASYSQPVRARRTRSSSSCSCDPGDAVLVPQPSYPLFELLTRLEGVDAAAYRLQRADDWAIDRDSVVRAVTSRTRAILVVSPNNPTGSMLRADDRDWLVGHRSSNTTLRLSLMRCSPTIRSRHGPRPRRLLGEHARADLHARRIVEVRRACLR